MTSYIHHRNVVFPKFWCMAWEMCGSAMFCQLDRFVLLILLTGTTCQSLDKGDTTTVSLLMDDIDLYEWEVVTNENEGNNLTLQDLENIGETILQQIQQMEERSHHNDNTGEEISPQTNEDEHVLSGEFQREEMPEEGEKIVENATVAEDISTPVIEANEYQENCQDIESYEQETKVPVEVEIEEVLHPCLDELEELGSQLLNDYRSEVNMEEQQVLSKPSDGDTSTTTMEENINQNTNPLEFLSHIDDFYPSPSDILKKETQDNTDLKPSAEEKTAEAAEEKTEEETPIPRDIPPTSKHLAKQSTTQYIFLESLVITIFGGLVIAFLAWLYQFYQAISNA